MALTDNNNTSGGLRLCKIVNPKNCILYPIRSKLIQAEALIFFLILNEAFKQGIGEVWKRNETALKV